MEYQASLGSDNSVDDLLYFGVQNIVIVAELEKGGPEIFDKVVGFCEGVDLFHASVVTPFDGVADEVRLEPGRPYVFAIRIVIRLVVARFEYAVALSVRIVLAVWTDSPPWPLGDFAVAL